MTSERPVLPLKEAYKFGTDKGLADEIAQIRSMEIEWDLTYTSSLRRARIVQLFRDHGVFDEFKDKYWPYGNTSAGAGEIRSYLKRNERYQEFLRTGNETVSETEDELAEEEGQAFAAESDLRDFLAKNLGHIEKGLRLYSADGTSGVEYQIDNGRGRIDLLAIDAQGQFVVVEFKLHQGRNKTLGQLLYYMGWVDQHLPNAPCRGVIIAKDITDDLVLAVQRASGVTLFSYNLSVSLVPISTTPVKK